MQIVADQTVNDTSPGSCRLLRPGWLLWQYGQMNSKQPVTEALEEKSRRAVDAGGGVSDAPPWMAGYGTLSYLADENRRILGLIEEEFEKQHSEDSR